ncbi:hypothetical protein AAE478_005624 [Parahypoxylon ruwenzoriense]
MAPSKARFQFRADLGSATEKNIPNITNVKKGDSEDEITFTFTLSGLSHLFQVEVHAQPQDMSGYPDNNSFLVYTDGDVPLAFAQVLSDSTFETAGKDVVSMLTHLSQRLRQSFDSNVSETADEMDLDDTNTPEFNDDVMDSGDEDVSFLYSEDSDGDFGIEPTSQPLNIPSPVLLQRIRRDLLSVFHAGFHPGSMFSSEDIDSFKMISISVRANKLSLSRETREAWDIASSDYIVLLIRFSQCYRTFEGVIDQPVESLRMDFRLRKCPKKKPSHQQANSTFSDESTPSEGQGLPHLWISKSIDEFMNNEFLSLLKLRKKYGISWESAKEILHSKLNSTSGPAGPWLDNGSMQQAESKEQTSTGAQLPPFLAVDHLLSNGEVSLPLVAMQFALYYLVRCTKYCTVCHREVKGNFEALRPYTCDQPLCLHQYLSLGFGPSIEYEIANQPQVVDLLISFCYASLHHSQSTGNPMREFPTGLGLKVPKIRKPIATSPDGPMASNGVHVSVPGCILVDPVAIVFDQGTWIAKIDGECKQKNLEEGQWVVVSTMESVNTYQEDKQVVLYQARIVSRNDELLQLNVTSRYTLQGPRIVGNVAPKGYTAAPIRGYLVVYEELDSLDNDQDKAFSMMLLLAGLPSVANMKSYLRSRQLQSLASWDRMSPSTMNLLRWIIASNRSYIVQIDGSRQHESISGVDDWVQFRFAQGSPEKESRFNEVLKTVNKPQKTIVAWHGSPLQNWHSIIRQGLDYKTVLHGRACGNGIYFSKSFDNSLSYCDVQRAPVNPTIWPQSALRINAVMSLNELVNLPERFLCQTPYVVQQCHWTQCRYLFVRPGSKQVRSLAARAIAEGTNRDPVPEFIQDPLLAATGSLINKLFIPRIAIPSAQGRHEALKGSLENDPAMDSSEDEEAISFLFPGKPIYKTDFRPGTLDLSRLPQLAPPSYATDVAQKTLGQEIRRLQKVQSTTPLHELGWYIDFEKMNNMFQWIVELHSFDPSLPLAQDMKHTGLTSIVLEIRFLSTFPYSPPFVRVVRPRFLLFMHGGGGHVTAGGAMCMELLTNTGWSPANSLESVLVQVRLALCSTDPRPARLISTNRGNMGEYSISEAINAYMRAAATHGWEVPKDFRTELSRGSASLPVSLPS